LAPISEEFPCGNDIRTDFSPTSLYFRLRDARADARAAERAADADPGSENSSADGWRTVRTLGTKILQEQAKDLEVAAWLTEALVRTNGLAGLAEGARLLGNLADTYWDNIFPMPDEDGMETRVAPVTGLNGEGGDGTLSQPLNKLRLFNTADGEPVMLFQYEQSAALETIADKARKEARINAGVKPFDAMQALARAVGPGNFVALRKQVREAQSAWTAMGEIFDRVAGEHAPPTRKISELLDNILTIANQFAPPEIVEVEASAEAEESADETSHTAGGGGPKGKRMLTREDALANLAEIAAFFRRTEPQSPLAYTIDDAIRRGRLTWPELLSELVADDNVRNNILVSLGIKAS
jgi:type VI secretion system protein ImpA